MDESGRMRWGLVGCGDVARKRVAAAIQANRRSLLTAVCRRDDRRLADFARDFKVPRTFQDASQLLIDPEIDAVYVATPVYLHAEHTRLAAESGKHVLVEKPMALDVAECDSMINACRQHGVRLGVAYYRRFYPMFDRLEQLLRDGTLGEPLAISATTATAFDIHPGQDGYWRVVNQQGGGGALMDVGSHRLNLFRYLFGPVSAAKAVSSTLVRDYASENVVAVSLKFDSGTVGSLQCLFETCVDPDEFSIIGTRGRAWAAPLNGDTLHIQTASDRWSEHLPPHSNLNAPQIDDFVDAVFEQRDPRVDGIEGRETSRILQMCYQSMQEEPA